MNGLQKRQAMMRLAKENDIEVTPKDTVLTLETKLTAAGLAFIEPKTGASSEAKDQVIAPRTGEPTQPGFASEPVEGGFEVGRVVMLNHSGERFQIAEIDAQGNLGRRINNVDPVRFYSPSAVSLWK